MFCKEYQKAVKEREAFHGKDEDSNDPHAILAPPVKDWNLHLGLIAQELQKGILEIVMVLEKKEQSLGVRYSEFILILIKVIQ